MYYNKLDGKKVYLSPMDLSDAEKYAKWINDLRISMNLGSSHEVINLESEKEFLSNLEKRGHNFGIITKADNNLIGNCSLFEIDHVHRIGTFGIFIGDEKERGKGYGEEAIRLILSYGFKILNLNNIMLRVFSFNEGAIKCYEKIGFKEFGRRRNSNFLGNKYYDTVFMDILRDEFESDYFDDVLPK